LDIATNTSNLYGSEAAGPFPWYSVSSFEMRDSTTATFEITTGQASFTNLRFPYKPLMFGSDKRRVFINYDIGRSSAYTALAN